jgi:hypothetical protein
VIASTVANWLAFGGLVFLICSASVTFAFGLGRVFQRVGDLRADVDELKQGEAEEGRARSSLREAFARFEGRIEAKLEHLDGRVAELTRAFLGRHGRAGPKPAPEAEGRP